MKRRLWQPGYKTISIIVFVFLTAFRGGAQDFFAGARGGASLDSAKGRFYEAEAFAGWKMPWCWNFYSDWTLRPYTDLSSGWITGRDADGFIATMGPGAELRFGSFPIFLEGGESPTLLSRYNFGRTDFGQRFQFTSHVSLEWDITKNFTMGFRFQHMSNAGLATPNPGLNIEMLSARLNF